jgi:dTDP-4-dehydrorhamnose 3,5-epimerase-like enzyme
MYRVDNIPKGGIGGNEFHRIRQEIIIPISGRLLYECEDLFGQKRNFDLTPKTSIWLPPFVMHAYEAQEDNSSIMVIANTLYDADDKETWDTYSLHEFYNLQKEYKKARAFDIKEAKKEINQWPFFRPLF